MSTAIAFVRTRDTMQLIFMGNVLTYINPLTHFGSKRYSFLFPFFTTLIAVVITEIIYTLILKNHASVGLTAIFLFMALIIYFSFRDGIRGGFISTSITILYYLYLIYALHYTGDQLTAGIQTTALLGILYILLSAIIGGLRQTIDNLIEREADGKRRLETIIQQLPVGVLITDNKGIIIQANKQADVILGIKTPIGFVAGSQNLVPSTYKDKSLNPSRTPLLQVLQTGKAIVGKEFILNRSDGKNINLQVSAAPITNKAKKTIAAALIFSDITQQKELEQRKDDFVNMASHELKTPITTLKLYTELLIRQVNKIDAKQRAKILKNIHYQTNRLQELVRDLLDVSRLQTGKLHFAREYFPLDELLKETTEGLQATTTKHKILFTPKGTLRVYADRFRIYQVFTNLITNAIKYSPDGKSIKVVAKKEKNMVLVSVHDDGIGIEKNQQKKIFEKLYQVNDNKGQTFPGFGMGLYISAEIVKRHGGKIWVESEKEKGATFYFTLPIAKKA